MLSTITASNLSLFVTVSSLSLTLLVVRYVRSRYKRLEEERVIVERYGCKEPKPLDKPFHTRWFDFKQLREARRARESGHLLTFINVIIRENGDTFCSHVFGTRAITTIDPENIGSILSTQFKNFELGGRRAAAFPLLGDGIFTQDGAAWKHSRESLRPQFTHRGGVDTRDFLHPHISNLLAAIPRDQPIDLLPLFFSLTLDTTTAFLFGRSVNSLAEEGTHGISVTSFTHDFTVAQDFIARRARLHNAYWVIQSRDGRKACAAVHKYTDDIVSAALEARRTRLAGETKAPIQSHVFLDALIEESQREGRDPDPVALRSQCLNILLAGRDTTASTLGWAFRLLGRNPQCWKRLKGEVSEVLGDNLPGREDLKRLPYLNAVLKETLRLYPVVPLNARSCCKTTSIPRGGGEDGKSPLLVREGDFVGYSVYTLHRRKDIYGPDAGMFRPDRWMEEDLTKKVGWGYMPFNAGPRRCLGEEFAMLEAGLTIVRIVQQFECLVAVNEESKEEIEVEEGERTGNERQSLALILSCAEGCWVKLT